MPPRRKEDSIDYTTETMLSIIQSGLDRQVVSPNALGYQPHAVQEKFHRDMARRRLYIGGNQSGKTTAGIIEDIWWATKRHPYRKIPDDIKIRGRVIGRDFDVLKYTIQETIRRWVVPSDLIGGSWEDSYSAQFKTLTFANGSTIQFKTYDQEILQHAGPSLHFIHFDEPPPKGLYGENAVRVVARYADFPSSGSWWMTYTPVFGMDWTYTDLYKPAKLDPVGTGISVFEADMDDNPYLTEEAKSDVLKGLDEQEAGIRKTGKYVQIGGAVFKEFDPEIHCISQEELVKLWGNTSKPPADWTIYWSIDHGLNAPTAILWHAVGPSGSNMVITFFEIYQRETLIKDHAAQVIKFEADNKLKVNIRTGDPAMRQRSGITGTSVIQEYAKHGIYINVESVPSDRTIGVDRMRQYLRVNSTNGKPAWRILGDPRGAYGCPNLVSELTNLHWKTYSSVKTRFDNNPLEQIHKKDDHAFDSAKYFFTFLPDIFPRAVDPEEELDLGPAGNLGNTYKSLGGPVGKIPRPIINNKGHSMNGWTVRDTLGLEELD